MPRFKDQAVCIRHLDWSETSQVVVLCTEQHGVIRGLAKGSKRSSPGAIARYSGGIELLTRGQVVGVIKATAELATLTEWDLQDPLGHLRADLEAHRLGLYAADLVGAMLAEHDAHPVSYAALVTLLGALAQPAQRQRALLAFQWSLLGDCGYQPELVRDVASHEALPRHRYYLFDAHGGGLTAAPPEGVATDRQRGDRDASGKGPWRVRAQTVELLRALAADDAAALDAADDAALLRANRLLCVYARAILDRPLPTMAFVLESER